jgi:hypothetical protein
MAIKIGLPNGPFRRSAAPLAAAKRRGVKLGGDRAGSKLTAKARKAGQEANERIAADQSVP